MIVLLMPTVFLLFFLREHKLGQNVIHGGMSATVDEDVCSVTFFLDLVELHDTKATAIESVLLQCLAAHGLVPLSEFYWFGG